MSGFNLIFFSNFRNKDTSFHRFNIRNRFSTTCVFYIKKNILKCVDHISSKVDDSSALSPFPPPPQFLLHYRGQMNNK